MQTMVVEVKDPGALRVLQNLNEENRIKILDKTETDSPVQSGFPLSLAEFRNWITSAEKMEPVSLEMAKQKWANQKRKLKKNSKKKFRRMHLKISMKSRDT